MGGREEGFVRFLSRESYPGYLEPATTVAILGVLEEL